MRPSEDEAAQPRAASTPRDDPAEVVAPDSVVAMSPEHSASVLSALDTAVRDLVTDMSRLSSEWKDAMHAQADCSVDHMLLYDSAAADLHVKVSTATDANQTLQRTIKTLSSTLTGMDILAAKIQAVKVMLDELEASTKKLL